MAFEFLVKRFVLGADEPAALRHQMWTGAFYGRDKAEILTPDARAEVPPAGSSTCSPPSPTPPAPPIP